MSVVLLRRELEVVQIVAVHIVSSSCGLCAAEYPLLLASVPLLFQVLLAVHVPAHWAGAG